MRRRKRSGRRERRNTVPLLVSLSGKKRFQPLNTQTLFFLLSQERGRQRSRAGRVPLLKHLSVPRTSPLLPVEKKSSYGPGQHHRRQSFTATFNNSIPSLAWTLEQLRWCKAWRVAKHCPCILVSSFVLVHVFCLGLLKQYSVLCGTTLLCGLQCNIKWLFLLLLSGRQIGSF